MANNDETMKNFFDDYIDRLEAYEHFNAIKPEKQERIIKAALEEFAAHDYQSVSTNTIVTNAGISKGLLFRYFNDKAGLFAYLQTSVAQKLTNEVLEESDFEGSDIFETLKLVTEAKFKVTAKYPLEVSFLIRIMKSDLPAELRGAIDETVTRSFESLPLILNELDESLLKVGLDREMVVKLVDWFCVGMTNEVLSNIEPDMSLEQYEELTDAIDDYFDFLRDLVYEEAPRKHSARHFR
jgi:AcrR family transcriptional regulator